MTNTTEEKKDSGKEASETVPVKRGIRDTLDGFLAVLGVRERNKAKATDGISDVGTTLAHKRTDMAMDRTYWAAQRTLMGWIRTSLSMISFGFTIGKIGNSLQDIEVAGLRGKSMIGVESIAYALVIMGTMALLGAALQYRSRVNVLFKQGLPYQLSIEFVIALVICVMGFFAFGTLVMKI